MDSTNSGSIQSSSSGDNEEYDSGRGESFSSFLNLPPPHPPPTATAAALHHHHLHLPPSSSIFDPLSPYFTPFPFPPQPDSNSLGVDSTWPRGVQPPPPSSSSPSSSYPTCTTTLGPMTASRSPASASAPVQPQLAQADRSAAGAGASAGAPRGPKKRSRASRRAPTTVLNTDTSNFRAMVQQFTGFPTPPFASSSSFPRPRLDLFGMGSAAAMPPYLLRPSAQKMPPAAAASPFGAVASSSSAASSLFDQAIASVARSTLANMSIPTNTAAAAATSSSSGTTPSSSAGKWPLSLFDAHQHPNAVLDHMQNTSFMSQSLLQSQTSPQYNSHALPSFRGQPQGPAVDFTMGSLGNLITGEGTKLIGERTDVLSGWMDDQSSGGGQESTERGRSKAVVRSYGNQG